MFLKDNRWPVAALLLGSGCCALVYQIGWLREFRLIFGASTAASAAVLAIFIGGLGLGGWFLGPMADRHERPLQFYASLEIVVAISAACTPFLLDLARSVYLATGGATTLGAWGASAGRLLLSTLVLAVPTLAMGGTLPAAARAVTRAADVGRRDVATLYALNTLGAVLGCILATFVLLEAFGTRQTLWLAAAVNLLVAMVARVLDRAQGADVVVTTVPAGEAHSTSRNLVSAESADSPAPALTSVDESAVNAGGAPVGFVLAASATIGFAFFLMELVWYRLLAPLLGGSVFTFGLVLAMALVGVGLGGLLYSLTSLNRPATITAFATTCLLEAAAVAATYAMGDRVAVLALSLLPLRAAGFVAQIGGWSIVTAFVVLPPALVAGYQFPLLIALFGRGRRDVGRQIGAAYAANTAGAIAGSLAGGFGLLPWLSAPGAWRLVALLLLALGGWALLTAVRRGQRGLFLSQMMTAGLVVGCLMSIGPTAAWRHGGVGAGRVPANTLSSRNRLQEWMRDAQRRVVWDRDGVESGVALASTALGYTFVVNGKIDGSARGDAGTQVMLGLIGALRHPNPTRSLVIGLGTGSTAGWLAAVPTMSRVDVVELEPVVLDVARASRAVNRDVMQSPKVHITVGDARELLLTTRETYDVIASEPSNPYRAGIASLFTQEYYRAAAGRMTDDGVFAQWVQAYEIDARTLRTVYATLQSVFPYVETWQTLDADLVLVARKTPRVEPLATLAARIAQEPYRTALAVAWRTTTVEGVLAHHLADPTLARAIGATPGVEINTDDRNVVEFGLARSVGRVADVVLPDVRNLADRLHAARGLISDPDRVAWSTVATAWYQFNTSAAESEQDAGASASEHARRAAIRTYLVAKDVDAAKALWPAGEEPRDLNEIALLADIHASDGSEAARPYLEALRVTQPTEADVLLAKLLVRQRKMDEAARLVEGVLARLRVDPWPLHSYKEQALGLADTVARTSPAMAARMLVALKEPLSLRAMDDARLQLAATMGLHIDDGEGCRSPVGALDPYAPWTAAFLQVRWDCYRRTGDARAAGAERDLAQFLASEAMPLGTNVPAPAR